MKTGFKRVSSQEQLLESHHPCVPEEGKGGIQSCPYPMQGSVPAADQTGADAGGLSSWSVFFSCAFMAARVMRNGGLVARMVVLRAVTVVRGYVILKAPTIVLGDIAIVPSGPVFLLSLLEMRRLFVRP